MVEKIKQIEEAILKAEAKQSKLDADTLAIGGMTGEKIRHLMNGLGAISTNYFEVGVHRGSLFFSTVQGNDLESAVACDNFSEFNTDGAEEEFRKRIREYMGKTRLAFMNEDCFNIDALAWTKLLRSDGSKVEKSDLYVYDGNHSREAQFKGVTHFAPMMADQFVVCIDDWNWADVQNGTMDGIEASGLKVLAKWELGTDRPTSDAVGYWNGFAVFLLEK